MNRTWIAWRLRSAQVRNEGAKPPLFQDLPHRFGGLPRIFPFLLPTRHPACGLAG